MKKPRLITVTGHRTNTLRQMLSHYKDMVGEIHLVNYRTLDVNNKESFDRVNEIAEEFGCIVHERESDAFNWISVTHFYNEIKNLYPNDWWIVADDDELHLYWDDVNSIIEDCENNGWEFVTGGFIDKIGEDGVIKELMDKGFDSSLADSIKPLFQLSGSFEERISFLSNFLSKSEIGMKGLVELSYIHSKFKNNPLEKGQLELDVTLGRGLNYYTGAIIEVKAHAVEMGSICGGGRYDDLTGLFGVKGLSGVGISFGADRIYDIMETLGLFPADLSSGPDLLFLNFSEEEADQCAIWANSVRGLGKVAEVYPSQAKMQKQLKYANDKGAKWVLFYGEEERQKGIVILKHMESGEQFAYSADAWLSSWEG